MLNVQPGPRDRRLLSILLVLLVVAVTFYIISALTGLFFYFGDIFLTFFLAWLWPKDTVEWVFGSESSLGLHAVDRETFAPTPKPSAAAYTALVRQHSSAP